MRIVISDPQKVSTFSTIFRHLKNVAVDVNMDVYPDKLYIQGMDDARVCLFELLLQKDWFEEYDVSTQEVLGIRCEIMFKMIGCLEDGQKITMCMNDKNDKLSVDFEGNDSTNKTIKKSFEMPLIMLDSEHLDIPEVEYQADITIYSQQFAELINQLGIFGDTLTIQCSMQNVNLSSHGEHGKMIASIKDDDIIEYAIEEDTPIHLSCGLRYIQRMCAFSKISTNVYLHFSNDTPIKLHYSLDEEDSSNSKNYVRFFVAPKIED
jgi:proliferating cell nuclear antigen